MVSNSLDLDLKELLATLKRLKRERGDSEEYKKWRQDLPKDWPI